MRRSYTIDSGLPQLGDAAPQALPDEAVLRAALPLLAEHPTRMGADGLDEEGGAALRVELDTEIVSTARLYALALGAPIEWAPTLGPERARIEALLDQAYEVGNVREAAEQLDADLADSDRHAGQEEQAAQEEILQLLRGVLSGAIGDWSPAERDALKIDAREVLGLVEAAQGGRQAALRQTLEARDAHRAAADEMDAEAQLNETVLALQHDRPVDDATLDEALSTFSALSRRG